jgi:hypothetical protein
MPSGTNATAPPSSATLHLSYDFSNKSLALVLGGRIRGCAIEAARAKMCFARFLVTIDVRHTKTAEHARSWRTSDLGEKLLARAQADVNWGVTHLSRRCRDLDSGTRTTGDVVALPYDETMLTQLAGAFARFFALEPRVDDTRERVDRAFPMTSSMFWVYDQIETDWLMHQDGDRGFQFRDESPWFERVAALFNLNRRVFYVGFRDPCPDLDPGRVEFGKTFVPAAMEETVAEAHWPLFLHEGAGGNTHWRTQHVSLGGNIMHMARWRSLWPWPNATLWPAAFVEGLRRRTTANHWWAVDIDSLQDSRTAASRKSPLGQPGWPLAVYMASSEGGCAVGEPEFGVSWYGPLSHEVEATSREHRHPHRAEHVEQQHNSSLHARVDGWRSIQSPRAPTVAG